MEALGPAWAGRVPDASGMLLSLTSGRPVSVVLIAAHANASPLSEVASWSSIVSASIAVLAVLLGLWAASRSYQTLALVNRRRRYIRRAADGAGLRSSWARFMAQSWRLQADRIRRGDFQVRDELIWLSGLRPFSQAEPGLPHPEPVPVPFTFMPHIAGWNYTASLARLSEAYDAYASSVRQRWLLRSAAGPVVTQEYQCARDTADLLQRWASFEPMPDPLDPDSLRGRFVELAPSSLPRSVRLVTWPDMTTARATPTFPLLGISFEPYRVVMDGSPARSVRPDPRNIRVVPDVRQAAAPSPLSFDGVLPRWHGAGYRLELDRVTGRQKLHLCVSETTYFAFQATQTPAAARLAGKADRCARVLTLNLLAIDAHDVVLLTRRSDYVVQAGRYTGTISGNCELVSREGLRADLDPAGMPDLLAAIVRETREELGLDLTPGSQLAALGVIEISSETELGTHILVATTRLRGRASEFRAKRTAPDPIEGLWEIGEELMTVDLGSALRDPDAGQRLVIWLRTCLDLTPGGVGSLLLLLTARLELQQQQASRAARNDRQGKGPSWTTSDLAEWLDMPLPDQPVKVADIVGSRRLWK
jgi:8-oxo-dGTP pyrophosphatase MutT (NUDIX family)